MHAYFELHIEQGPILEAEGKDIGVVTHGQGLWWLQVTLTGKESHTGSTPMPMRRNAGLGMARITELRPRRSPWTTSRTPSAPSATSRSIPNSRNIIPGKVVFTIDIRSPDQADARRAWTTELEAEAPKICEALGLGFEIEIGRPFRSGDLRRRRCVKARPRRRRAARLFAPRHRLRRRPRRLLDQPRRADGDGDVPLRRRPVAQRGRGDLEGMGDGRADVLFHAVVETAEIVG